MPNDVKVIHTRDFLRTHAEGEVDLALTKKLLADLADLNQEGRFEILIDAREVTNYLPLEDLYEIVTFLAEHRREFSKKIAVLRTEIDFDRAHFVKMCARNRGFRVDVFNDYEKAMDWLIVELSEPPIRHDKKLGGASEN